MTDDREPVIIAVCGKGGVGKTTLSAAVIQLLLEAPSRRVLAIDADPAAGLAGVLGVEVVRTVDDLRAEVVAELSRGGVDRQELLARLDYGVLEVMRERGRLAFLAIGRPERAGCFCKVNELLKEVIGGVAGNFDVVVIDGEAGLEQVNRRVFERVTHLLQVSDASARGLRVALTLRGLAGSAIRCQRAGLVLNRIRRAEEVERLAVPEELNLVGWVPEDDAVREADLRGEVGVARAVVDAMRGCLQRMGLL